MNAWLAAPWLVRHRHPDCFLLFVLSNSCLLPAHPQLRPPQAVMPYLMPNVPAAAPVADLAPLSAYAQFCRVPGYTGQPLKQFLPGLLSDHTIHHPGKVPLNLPANSTDDAVMGKNYSGPTTNSKKNNSSIVHFAEPRMLTDRERVRATPGKENLGRGRDVALAVRQVLLIGHAGCMEVGQDLGSFSLLQSVDSSGPFAPPPLLLHPPASCCCCCCSKPTGCPPYRPAARAVLTG
jgi:hypothetical protein